MTSSGNGIRVLFLSTAFPAHDEDPRGNHVHRLARQLIAVGVEIGVVAPTVPGAAAREDLGGIQVHRFRYSPLGKEQLARGVSGIVPNLRAKPHLATQVPTLVAQMWRTTLRVAGEYDLIHAHWLYPSGLVGRAAAKRLQLPMVVTAHGSDVTTAVRTAGLRSLARRVANSAGCVLTVSEDLRDSLISIGVMPDQVVASPLGIDIPPSIEHTPSEGVLRVLYVGSLIPLKGVDTLLEALGVIEPGLVEVQVIGNGPERMKLERTAKKLSTPVRFHGELSPSKVQRAMHSADVLVLPSRSEGRPTVVLEALAQGLATIATDIPGTRELINHNKTGLLFEVGHADLLAHYLNALATDRVETRRLGEAARRSLDEMGLSGKSVAQRHLDVYRHVLRQVESRRNTGAVENG